MERSGRLCIARCDGDADAAWKVGRIMLRFRPIAPKPSVGGGPAACVCSPRAKRKVQGREGRSGSKIRKVTASNQENRNGAFHGRLPSRPSNSFPSSSGSAIVTLPLMPETSERKEEPPPAASYTPSDLALLCGRPVCGPTVAAAVEEAGCIGSVIVMAPRPVRLAGSWVTLVCVTDTWREEQLGRASDEEVMKGMEGEEACPGFVSDDMERVTWMNDAYKKMVVGPREADGGEVDEEEVRVALLTRGMVPLGDACRAFTCRLRVRYSSQKRRGTLAAPCDVWRLEGGGLAWRLDIKAALSLSMGPYNI